MKDRLSVHSAISKRSEPNGRKRWIPATTTGPARTDRTFKTNLYALFWITRAALTHLRRGDCIINNSSIQAYEPSTSLLDYASTKAAINNFTVNLAAELGPRGIRVNAVAPGPIWAPLQPATQVNEALAKFGTDTPLGRAGQPAEVAPAFVFLASDSDASYVSGTVLGSLAVNRFSRPRQAALLLISC